MIIGYDGSRAFIDQKTGTENYSFQLLQKLLEIDQKNKYWIYIRRGADNRRWKIEDGNLKMEDGRWKEAFPSSTVKFINIPLPRLWTQVGLATRIFVDPLDVLFIPAHTLPLVRKPGLKTVMSVHDLGAEFLPQTHQLKQRLYLNLMTHYQLKSATHIIAVSKATRDDLISKINIPKSKITVIHEGYDREKFKVQSAGWRTNFKVKQVLDRYNLGPNTYYLFVGTIQPRKNLVMLIQAYALWLRERPKSEAVKVFDAVSRADGRRETNLKRATLRSASGTLQPDEGATPKLVLAGEKGWMSDEIYALPKKLGIEKFVKFLGYVPDEDLPALYGGAKAFLFPSLFEGFGLPILEAMACGCPVLTSNVSSLPEVAGEAAILVDPYSAEEIAQGIKEIERIENREKLIKMGLEQVKKFSWEKAAQETLKVLESV